MGEPSTPSSSSLASDPQPRKTPKAPVPSNPHLRLPTVAKIRNTTDPVTHTRRKSQGSERVVGTNQNPIQSVTYQMTVTQAEHIQTNPLILVMKKIVKDRLIHTIEVVVLIKGMKSKITEMIITATVAVGTEVLMKDEKVIRLLVTEMTIPSSKYLLYLLHHLLPRTVILPLMFLLQFHRIVLKMEMKVAINLMNRSRLRKNVADGMCRVEFFFLLLFTELWIVNLKRLN